MHRHPRHRHPRHSRSLSDHATSLNTITAGQTVELTSIEGGRRLRKRLADLGLSVGQHVRVVQNPLIGPLILAVKEDTRLAIGRGMARRIRVRPPEHRT